MSNYYIRQATQDVLFEKNQYKKGDYISKNNIPTQNIQEAFTTHTYHDINSLWKINGFDLVPVKYNFKWYYEEYVNKI